MTRQDKYADPANDAPGADPNQAGDTDTGTPPGNQAGDPTQAGGGNQGNNNTGKAANVLDEVKFSQRQLNSFIAAAKREARDEIDQAAREAAEKAQREEAEKQGNFKTLYETEQQNTTQLKAELDALHEKITRFVETEMKRVDAELEKWPESLKKLDPGTENPDARIEWYDSHKGIAQELLGTGSPPAPGNGPGPRPGGSSGPAALLDRTRKEMESSGRYTQL